MLLGEVAQSCLTFCDPMDCIACQAPLSMEFSRQEYWSGLPFPSPGDLPKPGIKPGLQHCMQTLYHLSHQGSSKMLLSKLLYYDLNKTRYLKYNKKLHGFALFFFCFCFCFFFKSPHIP